MHWSERAKINLKFPEVAHAFGVPKYPKHVPFNRCAVAKIVKHWEKTTGKKFCGKIFHCNTASIAYTDHKDIYLEFCDPFYIFHELSHIQQIGRGLDVPRFAYNNMKLMELHGQDIYFKTPTERDANIQAKRLNSQFLNKI